jgi:hypothetical protein
VRFTITGTYTVAHGDCEAAESDGGRFLDVDLSNVDNVVDDSLSFTVNIDSVLPVDTMKPVDTDA